jgi:monoamine oxidase
MAGMRPGAARDVLRVASLTSAYARRTGSPLDEAVDAVAVGLTRRRLLQGAGVAAAAVTLPAARSRADRAAAAPRGPSTAVVQPKVVIIGSGAAGLGCAYRLWRKYGIRADIYEYAAQPGGRIRTLRGHFADHQLVEEHAEFINPEHTVTLRLAHSLGLRLDNTDHYPEPHQDQLSLAFDGKRWSQAALNRDWHDYGWKLFHDAAVKHAPFPTLHTHSTAAGRRWDHMSVAEWVDAHVRGGIGGDFGQLCLSAVLDEYGGPPEEQSALNLIYLLGGDATTNSGNQPRSAPVLGGGDEKWHIHGGTDQLITGMVKRLPAGVVHVDEKLVAVRRKGHGRFTLTLHHGGSGTRQIAADHVVLALPFTTLRDVDLGHVDISPLHRLAIDQEPLGSNAKMFLQFDRRVWDQRGQTGNAYCAGVVQGSWDAAGYQPGSAGILAALPGGVVGSGWGQRYHLDHFRGTAPAAMVSDYLDGFNAIFPGVKAAYNGRSYYVWSTGDPHIRGAYSYLKVGQYTGFNGIQGRREGNLHFAGEHTSVNYQGYIEGALRSGHRCADEVFGQNGSGLR